MRIGEKTIDKQIEERPPLEEEREEILGGPADKTGGYEKNDDPETLFKDYLEKILPGFKEEGATAEDIIDGYEGDLSRNDIMDLLDNLVEKEFLIKKGEGEDATYTLNDAYYMDRAA